MPVSMSIPAYTAIEGTKADGEVEHVSNESEFPLCLSFGSAPYDIVEDEDENPVVAFKIVDPMSWIDPDEFCSDD